MLNLLDMGLDDQRSLRNDGAGHVGRRRHDANTANQEGRCAAYRHRVTPDRLRGPAHLAAPSVLFLLPAVAGVGPAAGVGISVFGASRGRTDASSPKAGLRPPFRTQK